VTDRRRNLFVLLLVAGLLAASLVVLATKSTKLGLDLKGGVELVYEGKPTKAVPTVTGEAIDRSIEIMRDRVDQLGVAEPEIQRSGKTQIIVSLPDVKNADKAQDQVGTVARLFFYDWEKNVLGSNLKPDPSNAEVTGGGAAGSAGCFPKYDAVARAARRPAVTNQNTSSGSQFYLVNDKTRKVVAGPQETEKVLLADLPGREPGKDQRVREIKEGTVIVRGEQPDTKDSKNDTERDCYYVLNDNFALEGKDIKNPEQQFDNGPGGSGQPNVTFEFSDKGRKIWQNVTREIAERGRDQYLPGSDPIAASQHFAIVLDGRLISTPYIDFQRNPDGIDARTGSEISGGFTINSAQELANLLKSGALPIKLELISQSQVSASLGKQALDQGLVAGIAGFVIVALFLLIFYRVLGMIAVTALVVYAIYFYALIKLIPVTLTLPGIAGLILTIGVCADANIVIFERVKEEIRAGRSMTAGIAAGYKKGLSAIIDANVVTFMVAFILFILATAGVKGFALVLGVGVIVSMLTAILLTQAILGVASRSKIINSPSALGSKHQEEHKNRWRFDYTGASRYFFSASGCILIIGALALGGKGLEFGIDFDSGTRVTAAFTKTTDEDGVRDVVDKLGLGDAKIQRITGDKELGANAFQIRTEQLKPDEVGKVTTALDDAFTIRGQPNTESIGPTFGNSVAESAVIAIIASLIVISAYIALRFEWKYTVPILIAVMHDILITGGVYALVGREVTTSTVAALLTILGFSLYDTIIVFDRVRENVPRMPRAAFSQIVNRSMSEVIVRSLATSFCALLPIIALFSFGGETLRDFAFALIVGTFSGTYSSVFIASPVLTAWKERESVYRNRRRRIAAENGGVVPAYADGSAAVEAPVRDEKRRPVRLSDDPAQGVSKQEFDAMVRDLHADEAPAPTPDLTADATPEDLVMKDKPKRDKRSGPRNKRHGRPR
jgi:SecD/SecF fusion protein